MTSIKTVTHGMSGTVRIIVTTSTIVNRPPMMIVLMATAPVQYPGSRSNFIPQRGGDPDLRRAVAFECHRRRVDGCGRVDESRRLPAGKRIDARLLATDDE